MAFNEIEFPRTISYRAVGGPTFSTQINEGFSGYEQSNQNWAKARGKWQIGLQTPSCFATNAQQFSDLLMGFFMNMAGRAFPFRFFDHKDFQATNQQIGVGTGNQQVLQLVKVYRSGQFSYTRIINKPIGPPAVDYQNNPLAQTVQIFYNGVQQLSGWSVDNTTGLVTCTPGAGVVVTASFQFHHPVRFDDDEYKGQIVESNVQAQNPLISWTDIQLIEVRI